MKNVIKRIILFIIIFLFSVFSLDLILSFSFEKEVFLSLSQKFNLKEENKALLQPNFELKSSKFNNLEIPYWKDLYRGENSKNTYIEDKKYNCSVLGLGDSIMAGYGVSHYDKTYFYKLSQKVSNTKWVNFGTPGYSLLQEMISYTEFENPENVNLLIWHLWIDDDFIYKLKDGVLYNSSVLLNDNGKPYLFGFLPDFLNDFMIKYSYLYNEFLKIKMKSETKNIPNDDYLLEELDNFLKNYFALGNDKKVLFIFSPILREKNEFEKRNPSGVNPFYNNIKNKFEGNKNIYFMDLGNYLNGLNFEEIKNKDNCDCHFNDAGHEIVFEKLYDFIKTNNLLDEKCY